MRFPFTYCHLLLLLIVAGVPTFGAQAAAAPCDVPPDAQVVKVSGFQAAGDGQTDDGPAIRNAITAALAGIKPAVVEFDAGKTYRVTSFHENVAIDLSRASNITIIGNGARLLLLPPNKVLRIDGSSDISVCGLSVDYSPLPFTQGLIVAADPARGSIDLQIEPGFDVPQADGDDVTDNSKVWRFAMPYTSGDFARRVHIKTVRAGPSPGMVRVVVEPRADAERLVPQQMRLVMAMPNMGQTGGAAFAITNSARVHLNSIYVHAVPQLTFFIDGNVGPVNLTNVEQRRLPDRVMTGWRGVFRIKDNRGPVNVDGCFVEGAFDDAFNLLAMYQLVVGQAGENVWRVRHLGFDDPPPFRAGDRLQAIDLSPDRKLLGEARIASVEQQGRDSTITLATPLPLKTGADSCADNRNFCGSRVVNLDAANENSVIRNCQIHGGVRLRSKSTLENSTVDGRLLIAIHPTREGPLPTDIVVRNSVLQRIVRVGPDVAIDRLSGKGAISWNTGERWAKNITFQNNRIFSRFVAESASINLIDNEIIWPPQRKFQISNSGPIIIKALSERGAIVADPAARFAIGANVGSSDIVVQQ
jgi:hypothetical protein